MRFIFTTFTIVFIFLSSFTLAQTGKITGYVRDAKTNEALFGANVVVNGTPLGASSDAEGYYVILNVPPGTYNLKCSMIGMSSEVVEGVRVAINQTTENSFSLTDAGVTTSEVVVTAKVPIVQKDVSSSTANINFEEVKALPVVSVQNVVGLQAGVQAGLVVRGGSSDETAFMINGITLRDARNNTPFTGISFTSVEEIQIQTGGFSAEYGNLRSGLVNVVTTEGKRDKYTVTFLGRYRPANPKNFGSSPNDYNSYWIRPYVDPAVAFVGTKNGSWNAFTQAQYQEFRGWNAVAIETLKDSDPTNDLTPEAAQKLFLWQHRRQTGIQNSDYNTDFSISGPVPIVSKSLGDLRFLFSYMNLREMYIIPLSDDAYREYSSHAKITSDLAPGMKITLEGLMGRQSGTNSSRSGGPGLFRSSSDIVDDIDSRANASYLDARVFGPEYWAPSKIDHSMLSMKFTHVLSPATVYEFQTTMFSSEYSTNPGYRRNTDKIYLFGNSYFDEAPWGLSTKTGAGIGSGMNMGLGFSNSRDSSKIFEYTAKFDFTSQLNKFLQLKTGAEFNYTDNNVNYAVIDTALPTNNSRSTWHTFPIRAAVYATTKLEFEGMVANLGLRLDYSNANSDWYIYDLYNKALSGKYSSQLDALLQKTPTEAQITLSPRLGIAFPITVDSKLYFNYGHSRSMPVPDDLYLLRKSMATQIVTRISDPNNPLAKTVAYELGYEHNIGDQLLLRLAGYYKDVSLQTRLVEYTNRDGSVDYYIAKPDNYQDIRGFEITLNKNRGEWVRGFINYTYMVSSSGNFGLPHYYEDPTLQREVERNTSLYDQTKPVPQPYGRANIDVFTPKEWGPSIAGVRILEDLRINFVGTWSKGRSFSWTGPGATKSGYDNNINWADYWNVDMRISKTFSLGMVNLELFADIYNVFNFKYMSYKAGFVDSKDFDAYMTSLHLPSDYSNFGYKNIVGNDKPGDVRTGPYVAWDDNASDAQKQIWLQNKSYIDMPNLQYTSFLNPRDIYWGLRLVIELK